MTCVVYWSCFKSKPVNYNSELSLLITSSAQITSARIPKWEKAFDHLFSAILTIVSGILNKLGNKY